MFHLLVFLSGCLKYERNLITISCATMDINVNRQIDADGNGYIDATELKAALEVVGFKIPQYKVRVMVDEMDANRDGRLSFDEFEAVSQEFFIWFLVFRTSRRSKIDFTFFVL